VQQNIQGHQSEGIYVLNRRTRNFEERVNDLVDYLLQFASLTRRQRIELRNRSERLSELFDWPVLIGHYNEAHDLALERGVGFRPGKVDVRLI
jgi:glycogen(starch) synthase